MSHRQGTGRGALRGHLLPGTPRQRALRGKPHLRKTTLLVLLFATLFSFSALLCQWVRWDDLAREDLGVLARLLPVFWSPYLGLALLALWLDRQLLRASVILTGSALVTLWGVYFHLDSVVLRPNVISQILSPIIITGNQWLGVLGTAVLAIAVGWIPRRGERPEGDDRAK